MALPTDAAAFERLLRSNLAFKLTYRNDPVAFVHDCFLWKADKKPTPYQDEILGNLVSKKRVAVRGPHGLGKTALASWVIHWYALTRDGDDWKAVTTASAWRQLTKFLWPEVHKWARVIRWDRVGREPYDMRHELLSLSLTLKTGSAFAAASDQPGLIEGAHADRMLYVFDESKSIQDGTFDAAEGAFSGAGADTAQEAIALAISTPGEPIGRFYDIHARKAGLTDWHTRHVKVAEAIAAGRISEEWRYQRELQWGSESAVYMNRVLGEFASNDKDGVIPLSWVEKAIERWHTLNDAKEWRAEKITSIGVDIAREGDDRTAFAFCEARGCSRITPFGRQDTMETTGEVVQAVRKCPGGVPVLDVVGMGAGVYDRLNELKKGNKFPHHAIPFSAGKAAKRGDKPITDESGQLEFRNLRSAAWWHLRERLDPTKDDAIALPPEDRLTEELVAPRWKIGSSGKIEVETKDDIRVRLGRSTDYADAVMMGMAAGLIQMPKQGAPFTFGEAPSRWRV